jgi:hypothetical protein
MKCNFPFQRKRINFFLADFIWLSRTQNMSVPFLDCSLSAKKLDNSEANLAKKLHRKSFKLHLLWTGEEVTEPAVLSWACSQYVGQLIYANVYGVTSAAYVLLTTLGKTSHQPWRLLAMGFLTNPDWTLPQLRSDCIVMQLSPFFYIYKKTVSRD